MRFTQPKQNEVMKNAGGDFFLSGFPLNLAGFMHFQVFVTVMYLSVRVEPIDQ